MRIAGGAYWACIAALFGLLVFPAWAAGPENVALVVNDASPLSRSIAEYYARKRSIPVSNVCRVRVSETEDISHAEYLSNIAGPLARCLRERHLTETVLYIVTTAGLPLRVAGIGVGSPASESASVDSELTLLYSEMQGKKHQLNGSIPNPFYAQRESEFTHAKFPIYLVTRLAAYDFAGVRALIDRGIEAQNPKYRGKGKIVIDLKVNGAAGDEWLRDASLRVPQERLVFDDSPKVIYDQTDVIAYAGWGSNDQNRKKRRLGFQWLPGAIMTEFVSTNARTFKRPPETWNIGTWDDRSNWFAGSPQTMTADYIEEGATGASGHVNEPFLQFCPHPDQVLPAYINGRNLAESYYLGIPALSWQNIVIGDPLTKLP